MNDTDGAIGGEKTEFLAIDTPFGDAEVELSSVDGEDVLSRCFLYRVSVNTRAHRAEMESLVGKSVTLWLTGPAGRQRPVNGQVRRVQGRGRTVRSVGKFQLEVVPKLWFLSCTADCRIFQNLSVPEIIREIFLEHGLRDFRFRFAERDYPKQDYCVQYQESAFAFVSRLMEHLGLFYWHEHEADKHVLMIADSNHATDICDPYSVRLSPDTDFEDLISLDVDSAFRPGKWTLNDYDFESPTKQLLVDTPAITDVPRMKEYEIYEYPGHYKNLDDGRGLSRVRAEMEEAYHRRVTGTSKCVTFDPGRRFEVEDDAGNRQAYLLTEVRHHASWPGREVAGIVAPKGEHVYQNEYVAIPVQVAFRPERVTPRPFVRGVQTATVVGPAGENIYCDEYGRVRVHFHWDRRGRRDGSSSCWLRVAQARSGSYYGTLVIPHVGHEVLVDFVEGDPDRPLITGTVPNALTMPAVELPKDKNKTVQRDHGDNKIVMQGLSGKEYLGVSSPKAVNMFASGRHAKPLSANLSPASDQPSYVFYADPTNPGVEPVPKGSTAATMDPPYDPLTETLTQTGDMPVTIYGFMDDEGLRILNDYWYEVTRTDTGASDTPGAQDGATDNGSYINSGSEGRTNSLTLGNNNSWTWGNANSWVNGSVNAQINQDSTTTVGGNEYGANNQNATSMLEVYGTNITDVHGWNLTEADKNWTMVTGENLTQAGSNVTRVDFGGNITEVVGDNSQLIFGLNNAINFGGNTMLNILINAALNIGGNITYGVGLNAQINSGINLAINTGSSIAITTGPNIQIKGGGAMEQSAMTIEEAATKIDSGALHMTNAALKLFL